MTNSNDVLLETDLPIPLYYRGKVRDTYNLGNQLLIVATDRISAFDAVLPDGIPRKGEILNLIATFWFRHTAQITHNHFLEPVDDLHVLDCYLPFGTSYNFPSYLVGRSMVVSKCERIPVECVVRGYLAGSAWEEYREHGTIAGEPMPQGMKEGAELPQAVFTPTHKADTGHDLPITQDEIIGLAGGKIAAEIKTKSLDIYCYARDYARTKGIIIADTKIEFGLLNGVLIVIDELLTPDSSRFWDAELYQVGQPQTSFDKQPVRDWLLASGWNKEPPAPHLPPEVIEGTTRRYIQAYERLTGRTFK